MMYKLISEGGRGLGTKLINAETGQELRWIRAIGIERFRAGDPIVITAELDGDLSLEGKAVFQVIHPVTGKRTEVKSITFADGEVWTC